MTKYLLSIVVVLGSYCLVMAQSVTFAEDVAEIIYTHCASCHRTGEIGPQALTNYEEVKDWGHTIQFVTGTKYMPPWQADQNYSRFLGENYLSDEQIKTISDWVDQGMLRGDVALEPKFPDFPMGSVLGTPDLVLEMAEPFLHKGTNIDNYRYFVLPSTLLEDKIVKAIEFRPGNTQIVHHALVFEDLTGEAAAKDAATLEYGFDGFGSFTNSGPISILDEKQFPGYVPGQKPISFPDGIGQVMKAGSDIVVQVHYAPWPVDEYDQSKLNIFFADENEVIDREVGNHIMVPTRKTIGEVFVIAAGVVQEFHGTYEVPLDVSLIGLTPHMHLLGKSWEVYLEKKNGDIVNLIKINEWDFNWQSSFSFNRFIVAEKGDIIHAIAVYDNTTDNPNNPNDPPSWIGWGEKTTDEMYYLPISYVLYKDGDENVIFEDLSTSTDISTLLNRDEYLEVSPNPTSSYTQASFSLHKGGILSIGVYNSEGKLIRLVKRDEFFNMGKNTVSIQTKNLGSGLYIVRVYGDNLDINQRFIKE